MAMKSLKDLYVHFLKDMFYAERQIAKSLSKMAKKAEASELRTAFEEHREETEHQIDNLEAIFEKLDMRPRGVTCEAMNGILDEGKEIMDEAQDADTRDAGMIAGAQAVEHYEISRYGTMIAWAKTLGYTDHVPLLEENLQQEKTTDEKLTKLAVSTLNKQAKAAA